jgi:hypothetical protein
MGCYDIFSEPMLKEMPTHYKGLYRSTPFPQDSSDTLFMYLWGRYVNHYGSLENSGSPKEHMGITTEMTFGEMKTLATMASRNEKISFEIVYFSDQYDCPHEDAVYYGIDVTGLGGYSMVGGNIFSDSNDAVDHLYDVINLHFRLRLNANCLFDDIRDAMSFRAVLNDLFELSPGTFENEEWQVVHVFGVWQHPVQAVVNENPAMCEHFIIDRMHAGKTPADFGLAPSSESDIFVRSEDGSSWKYIPLFLEDILQGSGYCRIPIPSFDELIIIVLRADNYDDSYGAAMLLLNDHADQLLERCLEMFDSYKPEQYYDFFQTLQLNRPGNRSPTAGKKYVQIAEDHRKWDTISGKVAAMEASRSRKKKMNFFLIPLREIFRLITGKSKK